MVNFDMKRLWRFARWTFVTDLPYLRKQASSIVTTIVIIMQLPNLMHVFGGRGFDNSMSTGASALLMFLCFVCGGSYMFLSFRDRKDGIREMNLLPASNLEKYLVRYLMNAVLVLVFGIISILIADALQYLVALLLGNEPYSSVTANLWRVINEDIATGNNTWHFIIVHLIWLHTFFLLGANFFRNVKYNWIFTALVLFLILGIIIWILSTNGRDSGFGLFMTSNKLLIEVILLVLSALQVWLSYKLFCSRQIVGKFINWI